jgi:hypothetical protein
MFKNLLTDELKSKGKVTTTGEYAWNHADAIEVIKYLTDKNCVISGGDVLNVNFEYTYDNWYYTYSEVDNISASASKATEYIEWYNKKFGDDFYYIIVATQEP